MEQHTCKLCNKSFLTGKVLGGHMRSHGAMKTAKTAKTAKKKKLAVSHEEFEGDDDERAGYGLRVNPKKSWKFSGSKVEEDEAPVEEKGCSCEVCGKVFDKMKSLFGHMRHHSGREKKETQCCKVCGKGFESLRALAAHGRSHAKRRRASDEEESEAPISSEKKLFVDCETMGLVRRKRSKRLRYKINSSCSSFSSLNESKYVTEFGQEIVDGAICLMIISNGGTNWGRISSVTESSDYNEVQSPGQKNLIIGIDKKKMIEFEENYSGFVGDEENIMKLEVEVPIQKFYDTEEPLLCKTEIEMDVNIEEEVELEGPESGTLRSGLSKKPRIKACDSGKNMISGGESEINADALKKREHKCRTCSKVFSSYQALGGHQRVHKAATNNNPSVMKIAESEDKIKVENFSKIDKIEFSDDSVEDDETGRENVTGCESKGHMCSICFKVFATGQALGGHKRVHFGKDSEAGIEDTRVMKQQISDICQALGLGQQVKLEDENGDAEVELFKSCWPGNEHKQELPVGLMPN